VVNELVIPCHHVWVEEQSEMIEETIAKNEENAKALEKSASKQAQRRGYLFENKSIDDNKDKLDIQKTSVLYRCSLCGEEQEIDIVGIDQIAEAKSRQFKGVKKKKKQATNCLDIQTKLFDPSKKPLAKLDGTLSDVKQSQLKYKERGFDTEILYS